MPLSDLRHAQIKELSKLLAKATTYDVHNDPEEIHKNHPIFLSPLGRQTHPVFEDLSVGELNFDSDPDNQRIIGRWLYKYFVLTEKINAF